MTYTYRHAVKPKRRFPKYLWLIIFAILVVIGFYWFAIRDSSNNTTQENNEQNNNVNVEQPEAAYQPIDLQPVLDSWNSKQTASYSFVVYDTQSKSVIGQNNPDDVIFAASLYKIYVAYLSLLDFQTGVQSPDEILIAGQTKKQCVDKMIRSSDSPCGEAMMAEIGQLTLNQRVSDMGMKGTTFNGIQTSAGDSALILQYINDEKDLNEENTAFLLDSMRTQEAKFKRGLQTGAPEAVWETKVGWNEDINYHDIGIMTLPDGRKFVVAILAEGSGSPVPIADFAKTVYSTLTQ